MASLTNKYLEAMGIDEKQREAILSVHGEVCSELKAERDRFKGEAEKLTDLTKERDDLKAQVDTLTKSGDKSAEIQKAFDDFKAQVEAEKSARTKSDAIRQALKDRKANETTIELLMKCIDIDKAELDGDKLTNADALLNPVQEQYSGLFGTDTEGGVPAKNPPAGKNEPEDPFLKGFGD